MDLTFGERSEQSQHRLMTDVLFIMSNYDLSESDNLLHIAKKKKICQSKPTARRNLFIEIDSEKVFEWIF